MLKITVVRKDRGMTQDGLAAISGIPAPQINAIERGRVLPTEGWQKRIADALEWERVPSELFEDVEV